MRSCDVYVLAILLINLGELSGIEVDVAWHWGFNQAHRGLPSEKREY